MEPMRSRPRHTCATRAKEFGGQAKLDALIDAGNLHHPGRTQPSQRLEEALHQLRGRGSASSDTDAPGVAHMSRLQFAGVCDQIARYPCFDADFTQTVRIG